MSTFKKLIFTFVCASFFFACKDVLEEVSPLPEPKPLVKQISYSDTDKQIYTYNAKGQLVQYLNQWQYIQNDPSGLKKIQYTFEYDSQHRLVKLSGETGFVTKYYYKNGVINKIEEINAYGQVYSRRTYVVSGNRLQQEIWESIDIHTGEIDTYQRKYTYDAQGNMIKDVLSAKKPESQTFEVSQITEFFDYDDKANPDNSLSYPFLSDMMYSKNNPGKIVTKLSDGTVFAATEYTYQYNEAGLPIHKTIKTTGISGNITEYSAAYTYQ